MDDMETLRRIIELIRRRSIRMASTMIDHHLCRSKISQRLWRLIENRITIEDFILVDGVLETGRFERAVQVEIKYLESRLFKLESI